MKVVFYLLTRDYAQEYFNYIAKNIDTYVERINKSNDIYILADYNCIWLDDNNYYYFEGKYHHWREVCISYTAYYHYCTDEKVKIKYLNVGTFIAMIIGIIIGVIAIITSLYLIGYFKYKKIKKAEMQNFSSFDDGE